MHHNSLSAVKRPLPPETISDQKILHLVEPTFDGISLSAGRLWLICALMKACNGVHQGPPGSTRVHLTAQQECISRKNQARKRQRCADSKLYFILIIAQYIQGNKGCYSHKNEKENLGSIARCRLAETLQRLHRRLSDEQPLPLRQRSNLWPHRLSAGEALGDGSALVLWRIWLV